MLFLYGDKLVGELNNVETLCHLIITNELESATVTVPNPFSYDTNISVNIKLNKNTKNKVSFINGYPFIECNVYLTGNVLSLDQSIDLSKQENIETIDSYVNTFLEDLIKSYLYKTAKDFKADIAGFGKYALPQYLTWNEWVASDWLNNYQNSFFDVTVETEIQGGYLFTKV